MMLYSRIISYLFITAICAVLISIPSCKQTPAIVSAVKENTMYTCSMHPQIMENHPGNCPICGMTLIVVSTTNTTLANELSLSKAQIELGNIYTDTIRNGMTGNKMTLAATLNFDQQKLASISSRVEGRITNLYFKNIGDYVHKGDKLYDIYSEALNNAKQEYVTALQQNNIDTTLVNFSTLIETSKEKLILWGMTTEQINTLSKTKQVPTYTTFYSNQDGYITLLNVKEGDYIMEGAAVIQLADMSTLWAEAQVYTTQLSSLDINGTAIVKIPDLNNFTVNGHIDFVNPDINPNTRINLIRVVIPNLNNQLHPGMPVYVLINSKQHAAISLPEDAVLRSEKGASVWIENKPGKYIARKVKTGIDDGNAIEIISGLQVGEVVVTSGAYLINSEYIFRNGASPVL